MIRVYMAGPLFSLAEREFNAALASTLDASGYGIECVLPQVECAGLPITSVAQRCLSDVSTSHFVVACLDGSDADSGTAIEITYAKQARSIPVIGYRTDFRGAETQSGVNAMILPFCDRFIDARDPSMTLLELKNAILKAIWELVPPAPRELSLTEAMYKKRNCDGYPLGAVQKTISCGYNCGCETSCGITREPLSCPANG